MTDYAVSHGVVSSGVTLHTGDTMSIFDGGIAIGTIDTVSATIFVDPGGVASGTVLGSLGLEIVNTGGLASSTIVLSGGEESLLGGASSGTVLRSGGNQVVSSGSTAYGTIVSSGGAQYEYGSSTTVGTVLSSGSIELEDSVNAIASGTTISDGSKLYLAGGRTVDSLILSGGLEFATGNVLGSPWAARSIISSGGREIIGRRVTAYANDLEGGVLMVSSGGAVAGGLTIHAGKAVIDGTVGVRSTIDFTGSAGTLDLNNLPAFHANISGLTGAAEKLELGGFGYLLGATLSWKQTGTSGTLTLKGDEIARLTLIGEYTGSDFKLANDFHNGTYISYQPPASGAAAPTPARFAQAAAAFSGRAGAALVHSGGTAVSGEPLIAGVTSGR